MSETDDDLLALAGRLAIAARNVVGGRDPLTGFEVRPANLHSIGALSSALVCALDDYDEAIVRAAQIGKTTSEGSGQTIRSLAGKEGQ